MSDAIIQLKKSITKPLVYKFSDWQGSSHGWEGPQGDITADLLFCGLLFTINYTWEGDQTAYEITIGEQVPERTVMFDHRGISLAEAVNQAQEHLSEVLWNEWQKPEMCHKDHWGWK
jgi:hypothetical protein